MNTYHMQYFMLAAELGSIQKAAQKSNITHSAISAAIRNIESELGGVKLISHQRRQFALTKEGEMVLQKFRELLRCFEDLKSEVNSTSIEPKGSFRIIMPQSLMVSIFGKQLIKFKKKYPLIKIYLESGTASQVRTSLMSGVADFGILIDDHLLDAFHVVKIQGGDFVLVSKEKLKDGIHQPLLITSLQKVEVAHLFRSYRKKYKQDPNVEMEIQSWGVIKSLVLNGFGVGYVPEYIVSEELKKNSIHLIKSEIPAFNYQIMGAWPKGRPLHKNAKLFLDFLLSQFVNQ